MLEKKITRPAIILEAFVCCLFSEHLVAGTYFKFSFFHGDEWKSTFFPPISKLKMNVFVYVLKLRLELGTRS